MVVSTIAPHDGYWWVQDVKPTHLGESDTSLSSALRSPPSPIVSDVSHFQETSTTPKLVIGCMSSDHCSSPICFADLNVLHLCSFHRDKSAIPEVEYQYKDLYPDLQLIRVRACVLAGVY